VKEFGRGGSHLEMYYHPHVSVGCFEHERELISVKSRGDVDDMGERGILSLLCLHRL
jgi:hypothetical protein